MDTPDLMEAIASRVATIAGIEGASYPALNYVPSSPWAMVRLSMTIPTTYEKRRMGQQVVLPAIDVVLLVKSDETRPADAARLDGMVAPILDLFDANAVGGNVNYALPGLDSNVDRVWNVANVRRVALTWGESGYCHAAILTLDSEFRRKVGP